MQTLKIVTWEKYQHYKHRKPPWIRLYNSLLGDYEYTCLHDASKLLLISLFLLASQTENKIPFDPDWIKSRCSLKGKVNLEPLISAGFITVNGNQENDASTMLASCKQSADSEKSREEYVSITNVIETSRQNSADPPLPMFKCQHEKIIELYHSLLPELPKVKNWTKERRAMLEARWREKPARQNLVWWERYFKKVRDSDFLMGKTDRPFKAYLEWLVRPKNFNKVLEDVYANR